MGVLGRWAECWEASNPGGHMVTGVGIDARDRPKGWRGDNLNHENASLSAPPRLAYNMLGPLGVVGRGGPIDLGSPRQKTVLGVLLINANRPLTPDQIIDAVWGESPPAKALPTLQAYV